MGQCRVGRQTLVIEQVQFIYTVGEHLRSHRGKVGAECNCFERNAKGVGKLASFTQQLEADIEYYTAAIEALEAAIEDPANDKKLADLEALVEMAELKVAAAQKAADEAKAKLDAALAE